MPKENNGNRRLQQRMQKAALIAGLCTMVCLLAGSHLLRDRQDRHNHRLSSKSSLHDVVNVNPSFRLLLRRKQSQRNEPPPPPQLVQHNVEDPPEEDAAVDPHMLDEILSGALTLTNLRVDEHQLLLSQSSNNKNNDSLHYRGVYAQFCRIDWTSHQTNPALTPMFRDVMADFPENCRVPHHTLDLYTIMQALRSSSQPPQQAEMEEKDGLGRPLDVPLVVFHESRCGSTLVANLLQAVAPTEHRVYSEHPAPIAALSLCEDMNDDQNCSPELAATVFKDTITLMARTTQHNSLEQRAFFKIQSAGSQFISIFQRAFPTMPWMYVYRDGVEVMMSHLSQVSKPSQALCVQSRRRINRSHPPCQIMQEILLQQSPPHNSLETLSDIEYCALHLATLTESAARALNEYAIPVNYRDLPGFFTNNNNHNTASLLASLLHMPLLGDTEIDRMQTAAQVYAKGSHGRYQDHFQADSESKIKAATPDMHAAAELFLSQSFDALEAHVVTHARKAIKASQTTTTTTS